MNNPNKKAVDNMVWVVLIAACFAQYVLLLGTQLGLTKTPLTGIAAAHVLGMVFIAWFLGIIGELIRKTSRSSLPFGRVFFYTSSTILILIMFGLFNSIL